MLSTIKGEIGRSHCPVEVQAPIIIKSIKTKKEKKETIAKSVELFASIDPEFCEFDVASPPARKTRLLVCRQPYNGVCPCFARPVHDRDGMFGTQTQVLELARTYRNMLPSDGYTLWVPFRAKGQYLAAGIYFKGKDDLPSVRLQSICYHDELRLPTGLNSLAIFRPDLVLAS